MAAAYIISIFSSRTTIWNFRISPPFKLIMIFYTPSACGGELHCYQRGKYGISKRVTSFPCNRLSFKQGIKEFLTHLKAADRASSTIYSYCSNLKQLYKIIGNVNLL